MASLSSPPELVSKLLDPWEEQNVASSRRITTLVNELAGEVRNGHKKVVVGASQVPGRGISAMGVSTPQCVPPGSSECTLQIYVTVRGSTSANTDNLACLNESVQE
jgi:hypothetical protein